MKDERTCAIYQINLPVDDVFVKYGGVADVFPVLVPVAAELDSGSITDFGRFVVDVPVDTVDLVIGTLAVFCATVTCGECP